MHEMITWWDILYWIAIIILSFVSVYLLFIFFVWIGFGLNLYNGLDAKVTENGLEIFSRRKGKIDFYKWNQIREIKTIFKPPILYPRIYLNNGSTIDLESASFQKMNKKLEIYNMDLVIKNAKEMVK